MQQPAPTDHSDSSSDNDNDISNDFHLAAALAVLRICLDENNIDSQPSLAFIVTDSAKLDSPIVHVSDAFECLTGYARDDILGKNARFLQAPGGLVEAGVSRDHVNDSCVHEFKLKLARGGICQHAVANYTRRGHMFANWITIVPIPWDFTPARFVFGFSHDMCLNKARTASEPPFHLQVDTYEPMGNRRRLQAHERLKYSTAENTNMSSRNTTPPLTDATTESSASPSSPASSHNRFFDSEIKQEWDEASDGTSPLDNLDTIFLVLTSNGQVVFASPSCQKLGYEAAELTNTFIRTLCHPADAALLTRELRDMMLVAPCSSFVLRPKPSLQLMHRFSHKSGRYSWFHTSGTTWMDSATDRKILLTSRSQHVASLSRDLVCSNGGGFGQHDLWLRLAHSGAVLAVLSQLPAAFGLSAQDLQMATFQDAFCARSHPAASARFQEMLSTIMRGERPAMSSNFELHTIKGYGLEVRLTMYPAEYAHSHSRRVASVLVQCKIIKAYPPRGLVDGILPLYPSFSRQILSPLPGQHSINHNSEDNIMTGLSSTPLSRTQPRTQPTPSHVDQYMAASQCDNHDYDDDDNNQIEHQYTHNTNYFHIKSPHQQANGTHHVKQKTNTKVCNSSNNYVDVAMQPQLSEPKLLNVWPVEVDNLRSENDDLRAELLKLQVRQRQRRRLKSARAKCGGDEQRARAAAAVAAAATGSAAIILSAGAVTAATAAAVAAIFQDCANCHAQSSPEWRRGPSGQRDLCNRCGLRWAKTIGKRKREKIS